MSSPVEEAAAARAPDAAQFQESLAGSLIDAARISVAAALFLLPPPPRVLLADGEDPPSIHDALGEAMNWLDHARMGAIAQSEVAPTSIHRVVMP